MRYSDVWEAHDQNVSWKWSDYLHVYNGITAEVSGPIDLLEIGVQNGGDLEVWKKCLPEGSFVVGIDIDGRCGDLDCGDLILIGNGANDEWLNEALADRRFDVIIDDGSHYCNDVIRSLDALWPRLKSGGWYVVEDLHTSYWPGHGGGLLAKESSIEYLKSWVDKTNWQFIEPYEASDVQSIAFSDSICVIRKKPDFTVNAEIKTGVHHPVF